MPRQLPPQAVPEFLKHYRAANCCADCSSGKLAVTVWDHYGTVPKDGSKEAERGTGTFIAALIICQDCGRNETLDRARLAGERAAE